MGDDNDDKFLVYCDALPVVPESDGVIIIERHLWKEKEVWFYPSDIELFLSPEQKKTQGTYGSSISGKKLQKLLVDMYNTEDVLILNDKFLEFLLGYPRLIPERWKEFPCICFWGTSFNIRRGILLKDVYMNIRCLQWAKDIEQWIWIFRNPGTESWFGDSPAAIIRLPS